MVCVDCAVLNALHTLSLSQTLATSRAVTPFCRGNDQDGGMNEVHGESIHPDIILKMLHCYNKSHVYIIFGN